MAKKFKGMCQLYKQAKSIVLRQQKLKKAFNDLHARFRAKERGNDMYKITKARVKKKVDNKVM